MTRAASPDIDSPYEEETLALLSKYSAAAFHSLKTLEGAVDSKDKPTVVALREIAVGATTKEEMLKRIS